jgi:hypothetical protein
MQTVWCVIKEHKEMYIKGIHIQKCYCFLYGSELRSHVKFKLQKLYTISHGYKYLSESNTIWITK